MNPIYIIKNNNVYEKINEEEAIKLEINNGNVKKTKEVIKYDSSKDFSYTFNEIKAKFNSLFKLEVKEIENVEEYESIIEEKNKIIKELSNKVKELEITIENLTKEIEKLKSSNESNESNESKDEK